MQLSLVLSQRFWFGTGVVKDDCWAMTVIQPMFAVCPWIRLPSVQAVRAAAGKPDIAGQSVGGDVGDIRTAAVALWPELRGRLEVLRGATYEELKALVRAGRPAAVSLDAALLPARLANGVTVLHGVTLAVRPSGQLAMANPWADAADRWDDCTWAEIRDAVMGYGRRRAGTPGAWAVAWPTEQEMAPLNPAIAGRLDELAATLAAAKVAEAARAARAETKAAAIAAVSAIPIEET